MDASFWKETAGMPFHSRLETDLHTDVLVIGGGIAGILCAYSLHEAGVSCVLTEAHCLASGTTGRTTAKITAQHGLIYRDLIQQIGPDRARLYLESQQDAVEKYRRLADRFPCHLENVDSFCYSRRSEKIIDDELDALDRLGYTAQLAEDLPLPFPTKGAVRFPDQAQFQPLELLSQLARQFPVYEHTPVIRLDGRTAITPTGRITAENIIVATRFPPWDSRGFYWLKMYQNRSYVVALTDPPQLNGVYLDEHPGGLTFRIAGDQLLLGGCSGRVGCDDSGADRLAKIARRYYPRSRITHRWAAQDCMTADGMPYIGLYSPAMPHVYVATGFHLWGMTSAMTAARVLTAAILSKPDPYADLFSPTRSLSLPALAPHLLSSAKGMLKPTLHRCTHLGCGLHYNPQEHAWECSCHGSRFSDRGSVLDGPAQKFRRPSK